MNIQMLKNENPGERFFLDRAERDNFTCNIEKKYKKAIIKRQAFGFEDVKYNINAQGYRSKKDFKKGDTCNVFLGCSHTLGEGVPEDLIWPFLVNEHLKDYEYYNLGRRGACPNLCYLTLKSMISQVKVKRVFLLMPNKFRRHFYHNENQIYQKYDLRNWKPLTRDRGFIQNLLSDKMNDDNLSMVTDAIKGLCLQHNSKFYCINVDDLVIDEKYRTARDRNHFGLEYHKILATKFIDLLT